MKGVWVFGQVDSWTRFYFETYLPDYAAMYDKLPISAFVSDPEKPSPDMELHNLQFWNCMDYGVTVVQKQFVGSMHYEGLYKRLWNADELISVQLIIIIKDPDAIDYQPVKIQD